MRLPSAAGLEVDMADVSQRDRLPSEVRSALKATEGFANYAEAQAVVRALTRLADTRVRETRRHAGGAFHAPYSRAGRRRPDDSPACAGKTLTPLRVGVVALYRAQAELI